MRITQDTTELAVSKHAMHKTKRGDRTFYWSWDTDGIGGIIKYLCFVDGGIISSGDEFMANKPHQFASQFEWALTPKQATDLYNKITTY
jgi:hypothetical protein